jgi:uncharacterized protein (DUF885 family)
MATGPWTEAEQETLRRLVAEGVSQSEIGRQLGRTRGAVANQAAKLGVRSDRTDTVRATEAKLLDAKALRAELKVNLLLDAQRLRQAMWQPAKVYNIGGKDNTYTEHDVDEPPFRDKLSIMQAATTAIDRSLKIDQHDADAGVAEASSLLDMFAAAVEAVADESGLDETETP